MIEFNLWAETFIFAAIYMVIIIVPCVLVALIGTKMITQLGFYPTKTPVIQMGIFVQLIAVEAGTFLALLLFYHIFSR